MKIILKQQYNIKGNMDNIYVVDIPNTIRSNGNPIAGTPEYKACAVKIEK